MDNKQYKFETLNMVHDLRLKYLEQLKNLDRLEASLCHKLGVILRLPARDAQGRPIPWERRR